MLLNGSDLEALSPDTSETPQARPLLKAFEDCLQAQHHYTFDFEPNGSAESTRELLAELPMEADGIESLTIGKSPPIAVVFAASRRASGHWVKLSVEAHRVAVRELRRDKSQLEAPPTVAQERDLPNLAQALVWLRSTCGKEPCAGLILILSPEQANRVIASALEAISAPNTPAPLMELRKTDQVDTDELIAVGRLAPERIQAVVRQAYGQFRKCYEDGLGRNAKLEGRVSVKFVIDVDGTVRDNVPDSPTLPDAAVVRCIVANFATLRFPNPEGGIVTVVYPIMLSPG